MIQQQTFPFVVKRDDGQRVLAVTLRGPTIDDQMTFHASIGDGLPAAITRILTTCTASVEDAGPWGVAPTKDAAAPPACTVDWARVPSGLRLQAMMTLKIHSKAQDGHKMDVDLVCGACRKEDAAFRAAVDIRSIEDGGELLWHEPDDPAAVLDAIVRGGTLPATVAGVSVQLRAPTGLGEEKIADAARNLRGEFPTDEARAAELALRGRALQVAAVQDVHPNDILRWVRKLPEDAYGELEAAIEAIDWGIDLSFQVTCPHGHPMEAEVPFALIFRRPQRAMADLRARQRQRALARRKSPGC